MSFLSTKFDKEKKIWYGSDMQKLFHSDVSLGQVVLQMLSANDPEHIIQISDNNGLKVTSGQMRTWMIRVATHFLEKGLQQEDIIGLIVPNSHNVAPLAYASFLNGHIINTLDPQFNKAEIVHMFGLTRPKIIFCSHQVYDKLKEALADIQLDSPVYVVDGIVDGAGNIDEFFEPVENELFFLPPKLRQGGEQTAVILCSSGTTGLPKGVCMSHEICLKESFGSLNCTDVYLCFSSLYWLSGIMALLTSGIYGCIRIITDKPFSAEQMLQFIEKYKVTTIVTSPTQMTEFVHCPNFESVDLSTVRAFVFIGGAVPQIIIDAVQRRLTNGLLLSGYGMTEVGGATTFKFPFHKEGSSGHVTFNTELKIIDDNGKSLGVNEKGEICIRTNRKPLKYYKNEEATKFTFSNEGWVHSGDIGYFDEDGHLFMIDRKKDIMKYKGYSISPTEIESVIMTIPGVLEVCVCGIPKEEISSDIPAAAVVIKKNSNLTENDISKYVTEKMADFKQLRGGVYFLDSLVKTPSGKIQRNKVKETLLELYQKKKNHRNKL